jgi:hypothetical protein
MHTRKHCEELRRPIHLYCILIEFGISGSKHGHCLPQEREKAVSAQIASSCRFDTFHEPLRDAFAGKLRANTGIQGRDRKRCVHMDRLPCKVCLAGMDS